MPKKHRFTVRTIQRYRIQWMLTIAAVWTLIDVLSKIAFTKAGRTPSKVIFTITPQTVAIHTIVVSAVSIVVAYLFTFCFRSMFLTISPLRSIVAKTLMLLGFAVGGNFLIHTTYTMAVFHRSVWDAARSFWEDSTTSTYLIERTLSWMIAYIATLLIIEINEKYSPGPSSLSSSAHTPTRG